MRLRIVASALVGLALTVGCGPVTEPPPIDRRSTAQLASGVNGTVRWNAIEGGFWAIYLDDGRALDPHESLPASFREEGARVRLSATALRDVACVHQAGIIVAIRDIQRR